MLQDDKRDLDASPSDRVLHSAGFLVAQSTQVQINSDAVKRFAVELVKSVAAGAIGIGEWQKHPLHPKTKDQTAVDWIFLIDTLNYSFWSAENDPTKKYAVHYNGEFHTGYWSLCAAVNRAVDEGIPILDPYYYSKITEEQFRHITRTSSGGEMPMIKERIQSLHEVGTVLVEKYHGTFATCIREAGGNSQRLVSTLLDSFPSYRDERLYDHRKVSFLKRAQILVGDLWACFEGKDVGAFSDIDQLTIFADYRLPQVLNYFGVLTYNTELQHKLDTGYMFENGEKEEMEIRGGTIWACELLLREMKILLGEAPEAKTLNAVVLDWYLWNWAQSNRDKIASLPFHRTRCIYY